MADILMKIDGVEGESTQTGYEGWIEIKDFSMSSSAPVSTQLGTGSGVGLPTIHGVSVGTVSGRHTPQIGAKYFAGQHFTNATVVFLKQTGGSSAEKYYELTLENVFVTSMANSKVEGALGAEALTVLAEIYTQEYFAQGADGMLASVGSTGYNAKTNTVVA